LNYYEIKNCNLDYQLENVFYLIIISSALFNFLLVYKIDRVEVLFEIERVSVIYHHDIL